MNTNTTNPAKTVEQLKEELRIAQEAVAEQERLVREQEREAKCAAERAKRDAEEKKIQEAMLLALQPVFEGLRAAGVYGEMRGTSINTGHSPDTLVGIEREQHSRDSYSFRSSYTGRLTITIGGTYQNMPMVRYPQRKDGGHNVEKIVKTVVDRLALIAAQEKAERAQAVQKHSAEQFAAQVRVANGYKADDNYGVIKSYSEHHYPNGGGRSEYRRYEADAGKVYLHLGTNQYTPEEVQIILAAFKTVKGQREAAKKETK